MLYIWYYFACENSTVMFWCFIGVNCQPSTDYCGSTDIHLNIYSLLSSVGVHFTVYRHKICQDIYMNQIVQFKILAKSVLIKKKSYLQLKSINCEIQA